MNKFSIIVDEDEQGQRIDKLIAVKHKDFTRSKVQSLCEKKQVMVNKKTVSKNYLVAVGDVITIVADRNNEIKIIHEAIEIKTYYEDEYLAVMEKPRGMLVYPTEHVNTGTLVNGLVYKYGKKLSSLAGENRPGIVHRLDKDTSGLLIIAFDNATHQLLNSMMSNREISRKYLGLVHGAPREANGIIEQPIGRNPGNRTKMAVVDSGRYAKTEYKIIESYPHCSLLEFTLFTGRTHQIRVHADFIGNPVIGDQVYGNFPAGFKLKGQCLHAYKLALTHPVTGKKLEIESPLPPYFSDMLSKVGN